MTAITQFLLIIYESLSTSNKLVMVTMAQQVKIIFPLNVHTSNALVNVGANLENSTNKKSPWIFITKTLILIAPSKTAEAKNTIFPKETKLSNNRKEENFPELDEFEKNYINELDVASHLDLIWRVFLTHFIVVSISGRDSFR